MSKPLKAFDIEFVKLGQGEHWFDFDINNLSRAEDFMPLLYRFSYSYEFNQQILQKIDL